MRTIILAVTLLASVTAAHAQSLTSQALGNHTYSFGRTEDGNSFDATTLRFGNQTYTDYRTSDGRAGSCVGTSYGGVTSTSC
jgi:hypothetical protein